MPLVHETMIYRKTEVLLTKLTERSIIDNMPKTFRYTIYPQMLREATEMLSLVYHAQTDKEERRMHLRRYLGRLEALKAYMRLAHKRQMVTHGQYNDIDVLLEDVGKQATAWKRSTK